MAEIHVIGQILEADGFNETSLFCKWYMKIGGGWELIEGETTGQTQTDTSTISKTYFCHPIDVHLSTKTIQNWPKIHLEVWHMDSYNRQEIRGYGTTFIPSTPGSHLIEVSIWKPQGSMKDEIMQKFLGGGIQLKSLSILDNPLDLMKLHTISMGIVNLRLNIILRNFDKFGITC
uniref:B9 domain-containing protein 2 n=1 Tax=Parastrongyloides trichosuri TaxID=131310 RepID=A0A0N4ZKS2_PARTI